MLVGIAKLAASGGLLEAKRRVEYRELPTRRFIGRCSGEKLPFTWTINPYRGCEFGCKYCYARYTHEFMELREPRQFEERIFAKVWDEAAFRRELRSVPLGEAIAIGTATDPYQPAERRFGLTRRMLEIFSQGRGRRVWVTTKSDLAARDADLLAEIGKNNDVFVSMTVTTMDEALARLTEPYAPRPSLRVNAIATLVRAGVPCGIGCSPVMPLINDTERNFDEVGRAGAAAGACSFHAGVLFLKPCAKQVFLPFVEEHFPHLVRRYKARYENRDYLRGEYPKIIAERVQAVRDRYSMHRPVVRYHEVEQMTLFN